MSKVFNLTDPSAPSKQTLLFKYGARCVYISFLNTEDPLNIVSYSIRLVKNEIIHLVSLIDRFFSGEGIAMEINLQVLNDANFIENETLNLKILGLVEIYLEKTINKETKEKIAIPMTRYELHKLKEECIAWLGEND